MKKGKEAEIITVIVRRAIMRPHSIFTPPIVKFLVIMDTRESRACFTEAQNKSNKKMQNRGFSRQRRSAATVAARIVSQVPGNIVIRSENKTATKLNRKVGGARGRGALGDGQPLPCLYPPPPLAQVGVQSFPVCS